MLPRALPPAGQSDAATARCRRRNSANRMCPKMTIIARPSVAMIVQSSGMAKLPPACTDCLATRPIIHSPLPSTTSTATPTAAKKSCSTSSMSRTGCGAQKEMGKHHAADPHDDGQDVGELERVVEHGVERLE